MLCLFHDSHNNGAVKNSSICDNLQIELSSLKMKNITSFCAMRVVFVFSVFHRESLSFAFQGFCCVWCGIFVFFPRIDLLKLVTQESFLVVYCTNNKNIYKMPTLIITITVYHNSLWPLLVLEGFKKRVIEWLMIMQL